MYDKTRNMYFWKIRISYNFGLEVFVAIRTSDGKMHVLIISDDNIRWLCQLHGWLHPTWECQTASPTPSQIQFSRSHSRWKWEIMLFEISFAFLETCRCRRDCARCWYFLHRPRQGFLIQRESSPGVWWLFFRISEKKLTACPATMWRSNTLRSDSGSSKHTN